MPRIRNHAWKALPRLKPQHVAHERDAEVTLRLERLRIQLVELPVVFERPRSADVADQIVVAERKENGHIRFRAKMVDVSDVKAELKAAKG